MKRKKIISECLYPNQLNSCSYPDMLSIKDLNE